MAQRIAFRDVQRQEAAGRIGPVPQFVVDALCVRERRTATTFIPSDLALSIIASSAEYALCAQTGSDGQMKRVARPQLQSFVRCQLGGAAEFLSSGNSHRAMLLRKFVDARHGLFRHVRCRLASSYLYGCGRCELDQGPRANRQSLARRLELRYDSVTLRLSDENWNEGTRIEVNHQ